VDLSVNDLTRARIPEQRSGTRAVDEDSFGAFYQGNQARLVSQLTAYCGNQADAQDIVQEAFCKAYLRWNKIAGYDDPVAWVRTVAWNMATSRWRRGRVALKHLLTQREEHTPQPSPDRVALTRALATLPSAQRRAVVLYYLGDVTIGEIANQEGVAEGTVRSWLHRARTALSIQLNDQNA
jgi:RNA polymerase sigma-70 factor, ECF subfamily